MTQKKGKILKMGSLKAAKLPRTVDSKKRRICGNGCAVGGEGAPVGLTKKKKTKF